jgi:hypothetical protein
MEKEEKKNLEELNELIEKIRKNGFSTLLLSGEVGDNRWRGKNDTDYVLFVKIEDTFNYEEVGFLYGFFTGEESDKFPELEIENIRYFYAEGKENYSLSGLLNNLKETGKELFQD